MRPWLTLEKVSTPAGPLELRQRGDRDFLIMIDGRVLMTSAAHRSEDALAQRACEALAGNLKPRILLGGLGMGFTLRAALDRLPRDARIDLVDLNECVVNWCKGPLRELSRNALADRRVNVILGDVTKVIAQAPLGHYHAIIIDLYEGPHAAVNGPRDPLYGISAIAQVRRALTLNGIFAVWSEEPDRPFEERLDKGGFAVKRLRSGEGGSIHAVYLATRQPRPAQSSHAPRSNRPTTRRASQRAAEPQPSRR